MKLETIIGALLACLSAGAADLTFENESFKLVVGEDAVAKSLVVKATGEEALRPDSTVPLFSSTQTRPFNNEVKLIWPSKRTVYPANRIRREGDRLFVGFEIAPYEAVVEVKTAKDYIAFTLVDFIDHPSDYGRQKLRKPPLQEFRVLQLPVKDRANYGCWLGASWDEKAAVAILGTGVETQVDQERREGYRVFAAWAEYGVRLRGVGAALIAAPGRERFLDAVASVEDDYALPKGVAARRADVMNESVYWVGDADPSNIDEHIRYAKEGGFRRMTLYYTCMCKDGSAYYYGLGDYDWRDSYPNKEADMRAMIAKMKAAGITPGLHVLQTHIGFESRYVTPEADPRLSIVRKFTLAAPIERDEIRVQENTDDVVTEPLCRVLKFGTELIGYTDVKDGVFTGLERGKYRTTVKSHARGEIGGLLDVCEYSAHSCYLDQDSDLQDEIAAKIKRIYDCGFEFYYMDGSEGVVEPMAYNVARSQYKVWRSFAKEPMFGSGAAKSHFGWHLLAGSNAFDIFGTDIFKAMIVKYPMTEVPIMAQDFTRVNFGWWMFWAPGAEKAPNGIQADHWEYGMSRAMGWECPMTVQMKLKELRRHPRRHDLLETLRRWQDFRSKDGLTADVKESLKCPSPEHHLYLNETGAYELHPIEMLPAPSKAPLARGFVFERNGKRVLAVWHQTGEGTLKIDLGDGEKPLSIADRRYLETDLSVAEAKAAFARAEM